MSEKVYAHFIGIGGAGMSAIARVLHDRGTRVTGSDLKESRYSRALTAAGVPVSIGHDASNLGDPEVVVISSAIPERNPELAEARRRGLPVWQRAKMLAALAGEMRTVAVAGTHGKTTTSSMVASMLTGAGLSPTFLIGGELNEMGGNAGCGEGDLFVIEADESDGSFLCFDPFLAIVTNVEADHLDHYADLEEVSGAFGEFLSKVRPEGAAVVCADDPRLVPLARERSSARVVTYGIADEADVRCVSFEPEGIGHRFTVRMPDGAECTTSIAWPGVHNVVNATGALAAAWVLGLDTAACASALARFGGVRRRFDRVGEGRGVTVVDDYAHHPTEVRATLSGARATGAERVWAVFQPHRFSRTAALGSDFGRAFADADRVVLMDVYDAGESPVPGVSGRTILDALLEHDPRARAAYFPHRADVVPFLTRHARPGDLVLTLGAGDVTTLGPELVRALQDGESPEEARCP